MNIWYLTAAAGLGVCFGAHLFLGGREVAGPLRRSAVLEPVQRWLLWYCWHGVTLLFAVLGLALLWAGLADGGDAVAVVSGILVTAFGGLGLVLPGRAGLSLRQMPQGVLVIVPGLLALFGAVA